MSFVGTTFITLLLVLAGLRGCTRGAAMIELNDAMAGRAVEVKMGQQIRVTLAENRTTGFQWHVGDACGGILTMEENQAKPGIGAPGAAGEHVWVFATAGKGRCELRFESARPWEKSQTGKTITFPITVTESD